MHDSLGERSGGADWKINRRVQSDHTVNMLKSGVQAGKPRPAVTHVLGVSHI